MTVFTVFCQMLSLLIMIGSGYLVAKKKMIDDHTNSQLSEIIVKLLNPLLFFSSAANSVGLIPLRTMGLTALIAVGMFVIFIIVGVLLAPFFDQHPDQRKIFQMMFIFSNLGFIGIPVVSSILGSEYVVYVTEFLLVYNLVFYTYGVAVMDGHFNMQSLKAMINPGTICSLLAIAVIVFEIEIPEFIKTAITYLGNAASPMALILVGFTLAHSDLKKVFGEPRLYIFSLIKLLILPLLMLPLLRMVTKDQALISVCMVLFAMPTGNMPLMLGNQRGIDGSTCSASIILTTILCVCTVPVVVAVVG